MRRAELADATQEALVEVLAKLPASRDAVSLDDPQARHELMRIVSNVALRARRRLQRENDRYLNIDHVEMVSARDEEAWVEARVVVLMALENLDEPTRALIYAHEIEGRTNLEIAATLKLKEDAVEKRVFFAKQRLRAEVEHLERGRPRLRHQNQHEAGVGLAGLGFDFFADPFDRAFFGATYDVLGANGRWAGLSKARRFTQPNLPTTALVGALVFAPLSPDVSPDISPSISQEMSPDGTALTEMSPVPFAKRNFLSDLPDLVPIDAAPALVAPARAGDTRPRVTPKVRPESHGSLHSAQKPRVSAKGTDQTVVNVTSESHEMKELESNIDLDERWNRVEAIVAPL